MGPTLFWPYAKAILALESWIGTHGAILGMEESQIGRTLWVKAISDTVEHLVPRPLPYAVMDLLGGGDAPPSPGQGGGGAIFHDKAKKY